MNNWNVRSDVTHALRTAGVYSSGVHFIVDGQFGSTGKGLMASVYAEAGRDLIDLVTTNAGPNSGHSAHSLADGSKFMTQQIPVASVVLRSLGKQAVSYLNAGAVIDPVILAREINQWDFGSLYLAVHPNAAVIEQVDRDEEAGGSIAAIASTGKGVGSALARKILRRSNVAGKLLVHPAPHLVQSIDINDDSQFDVVLVETAQGFSLGINSQFYPHTTSRECTVMQAAADARIAWRRIKSVIACYRTFPIRVGNTSQGQSGDCYPDQQETSWEALGVEPELTSVTKRVRRVFTWSRLQFVESVAVNQPNVIFLNFANYLTGHDLDKLTDQIHRDYRSVMGRPLPLLLLGSGPYNGDVEV